MSGAEPRIHDVRPPSARTEGWNVFRVAFHIVFWAAIVIGLERGANRSSAGGEADSAAAAMPFGQLAFADLPVADQRIYRALQEGMTEAENGRAANGKWPEATELADQGVPPFAIDPLDLAHYQWRRLAQGTIVNYLGEPSAASGRPWFLVLIVEPEPGTPVDPMAQSDEVHHKLPDGSMLHVSIWLGPPLGSVKSALDAAPVEQGWKQIFAGTKVTR